MPGLTGSVSAPGSPAWDGFRAGSGGGRPLSSAPNQSSPHGRLASARIVPPAPTPSLSVTSVRPRSMVTLFLILHYFPVAFDTADHFLLLKLSFSSLVFLW